jgi:hypothetical protein
MDDVRAGIQEIINYGFYDQVETMALPGLAAASTRRYSSRAACDRVLKVIAHRAAG